MAKTRKLQKAVNYETGVVTMTVISTGAKLEMDTKKLPKDVQAKLVPLAINHRVGDAAAGRDGEEALKSMAAVWDALMSGQFTVRTPAAGLNKAKITEKLESLKGPEAAAAKALLEKLGISL